MHCSTTWCGTNRAIIMSIQVLQGFKCLFIVMETKETVIYYPNTERVKDDKKKLTHTNQTKHARRKLLSQPKFL